MAPRRPRARAPNAQSQVWPLSQRDVLVMCGGILIGATCAYISLMFLAPGQVESESVQASKEMASTPAPPRYSVACAGSISGRAVFSMCDHSTAPGLWRLRPSETKMTAVQTMPTASLSSDG
ncbi:hypothetical protein CAC42_3651 [Sphaceloma murrayae]|uniref:Uncharacterized protein n=1 Tax=Sphaceloma murrayae TaxID=2082308 RepID=A0A2K1QPY0_9PEZI|nr:hypothetical protein CAC42_3651 [Sphaceloma murrayae]